MCHPNTRLVFDNNTIVTNARPITDPGKYNWAASRENQQSPRRLIRNDTFRLLGIFCFGNHYPISLSPWAGNVRWDLTAWAVQDDPGQYFTQIPLLLVFPARRLKCNVCSVINGAALQARIYYFHRFRTLSLAYSTNVPKPIDTNSNSLRYHFSLGKNK